MRALVIEDDPEIVESIDLAFQLGWPDMQLRSTQLGRSGVELAGSDDVDLVIVDLGLPDISGFEVLKQIRAFSTVPVIILTVAGEEQSIVKGLEWGADDYIVKPCGQLELLARVRARLRDRSRSSDDAPISLGALQFDPLSRELASGSGTVALTAVEARIMHCLIMDAGRPVTYSRLAEDVWGEDYPGSVHSLRVHVSRLRQKIEDHTGNSGLIQTLPGVGYFLERRGQVRDPS
jgi:two-component system KDP operon response regulator KdpE